MSDDTTTQETFNEIAKDRLADPMVTDEPRESSTLDPAIVTESGDELIGGSLPFENTTLDPVEFDEAPGDFETEVLSRLEDLESTLGIVMESQTNTHDAMEHIVNVVNKISEELEPTIKQITESKWFRMIFPAPKEIKS